MNLNYFCSTRIITGKNCVINNYSHFRSLGNRCLIVTGYSSAKKSGALKDVQSVLNSFNISYDLYDKISQNPSVTSCINGGKIANAIEADFIIGIGGGSPLDASKAIAVFATNPNLTEEELYSLNWTNKPLPVVTIGTTAGTGSEVTSIAVLTNSMGFKKSFKADSIFPILALGDPAYTMSLSEEFTSSTAMDALAHCIESYFNRTANDISMTFAIKGVKTLLKGLRALKEKGATNLSFEDREQLYNGSIYGGLAINSTGTAFPHTLGYFLTELHGVSHGTACATFLPFFIEHNARQVPELADPFFKAINIEKEELIALIKSLTPSISLKLTEADITDLSPRWINNKNFINSWGKVDSDFVFNLLTEMF
ncbi:MAG: iron-containing alcohol dehydrogenase family protein [Clostridiaceae bacterium]